MADANGFILHPLTGDGSPATEYPASDYRIAINSLQSVPDGTPFGGISGIRAGAPSPLVKCDGTTAVVSVHAGWIQAWGRMYSYAVTTDHMLHIPTSTGSYKIALVVSDKAAGHGDSEGMSIQALPATTPDAQISGMVIARVDAGVASDTALTIQPDMLITAPSKGALDTVTGIDGQRSKLADGTEYTLKDGVWEAATQSLDVSFKPQDAGSFQMMGTPMLHVRDGYIETDLTGVRVAVNVSRFPMLLWTSGPKPSRNIDLGYCYVYAPDPYYSKRLTWQTDGNLVVDDASNGDRLVPVFRRVPIPGGVTFG